MASIGELKKATSQLSSLIDESRKALSRHASRLEIDRRRAADILSGTSSSVEKDVLSKLARACEENQNAIAELKATKDALDAYTSER